MRTAANVGKVLLCLLTVLFVFAAPLAAADVVEYRLKQIEETSAEQKKQLDRLEHRTANIEEDTTLLSGFSNQVSKFGLPKWAGQFVSILLAILLTFFGYLIDAKRRIDKIKKEAKEEKDEVSRKFNDFQKTHKALEVTYQEITKNYERLTVLLEQDNIESNNRRLAALLTNIDDGNPLLQQVSEVQKAVDVLKTAQPITLEDALAMKIEDLRNVAGIYLFPCHARLAMEEGNWEEACFFWQKYLAVAPDNAVSLYYLGWCLLQQGKSTKDILPADQFRLFIKACYYFEHVPAMPDLQGHKHFQWPLSEARFRASFCCAEPQKAKRLRRKAMESLADIAGKEHAYCPEEFSISFLTNLGKGLPYRQRRLVTRIALLICHAVEGKYVNEASFVNQYGVTMFSYSQCTRNIVAKRALLQRSLEKGMRAIELDPKNSSAWSNAGSSLTALANLGGDGATKNALLLRALEKFERGMGLDPTESSNLKGAGFCLNALADLEVDATAKKVLLLRALEKCERAIELDPKNSSAWNNAGYSLHELAKLEASAMAKKSLLRDAREKYERAIELDPKSSSAWNNAGYSLTELAKLEEDDAAKNALLLRALEKCERAIELDPANSSAWNNAGYNLTELANWEGDDAAKNALLLRALEKFERAVELDPTDDWAWGHAGASLIELAILEEDAAAKNALLLRALEKFERAVELDPTDDWAWGHAGASLIELAMLEEDAAAKNSLLQRALEKNARVVELTPTDRDALSDAGFCLNELASLEEDAMVKGALLQRALEKCMRAIELDPAHSSAWSNAGYSLIELARLEEDAAAKEDLLRRALEKFARTVELDPTDDWARERVESLQSELAKMA